jgi:hypothetical protein
VKDVLLGDMIKSLVGIKCICTKELVHQDKSRAIIKSKSLVFDLEKGQLEIRCRQCGAVNITSL